MPSQWEILLRPVAVWMGLGLIIGLVIDQRSIETARVLALSGAVIGAVLGARLVFRNRNR